MEEIFKDVVNYEGLYQISNLGNLKTLRRFVFRKNGSYYTKERLIKPSISSNGYYQVSLYRNKQRKGRTIHSLVAESFLNHKPNGYILVVNHKNFIRTDNRVENLEIVTMRENSNLKHIPSSSKYVGVYFDKKYKKWKSIIHFKGKLKTIGTFVNEIDAYNAYQNKLKEILTNT